VKVASAPPALELALPVVASAVLFEPPVAKAGVNEAVVVAMFEISQSYLLNSLLEMSLKQACSKCLRRL
jgi:hypothetical protein